MANADDDAWFNSEKPLHVGMIAELQRLKRRARAHPVLIVVIALLATGGLMAKLAQKPKILRAKVILAVSEGDFQNRQPLPAEDLRNYIYTVLLPNEKLMPIIKERDLFPRRAKFGDNFALEELRDMFSIDVWRNYFLYGFSTDEARTARVAVVVTDTDGELALWLARRLAATLTETEAERRRQAAEGLVADVREAVARAQAGVHALEQELSEKSQELAKARVAGKEGPIAVLKEQVTVAQQRLRAERTQLTAVEIAASDDELGAAIEAASLGLSINVVDERRPPPPDEDRVYRLWVIACVLFVIMLPTVAVFVGAFDSRVHDVEDVARLNLPVVGHLPAFPGDHLGALRSRLGRRSRRRG